MGEVVFRAFARRAFRHDTFLPFGLFWLSDYRRDYKMSTKKRRYSSTFREVQEVRMGGFFYGPL